MKPPRTDPDLRGPVHQTTTVDLPEGPAEPWERQPRETDTAWALFQAFRDSAFPDGVGASYQPRSLTEFAKWGTWELSQIRRIAQTHDWHNRAAQYDRHVDAKKTEANLSSLPEVLDDHKRALQKMRKLVVVEIDKWLKICEEREEPQLKMREIKGLIDCVIKLDRLTYGEATEIVELVDQWEISGLGLDSLKQLREIAVQAGGEIKPAG